MKQNEQPLISVIIPTYNEERDIKLCIETLKKQTYRPLEIIVVDDGSDDKTLKILKKEKGIHWFRENHLGPGAARNKGAKKARGKILVFVDADMTFDKRFIDKLTKPIREQQSIGTFSRQEFVSNQDNRWAKCWSINHGWELGRMHKEDHPKVQKVFRAVLADKFQSVSGFKTDIGYTDDWTLSDKLGQQAVEAPGAVFFHRNPDSLSEAFRQARWMAKRPYKLGILGRIFSLIRCSLPVSLIVGIIKSLRFRTPSFLAFKLVVDYATFVGVSSLFFGRRRVK